jgi:glyoxylase-like metal-dependent hydrolase (beta-lactamase superfamily II)
MCRRSHGSGHLSEKHIKNRSATTRPHPFFAPCYIPRALARSMEDTLMRRFRFALGLILATTVSITALAQAPAQAPPKPDSPEVQAMLDKARKTAGTMWADEERFFCEAPRANAATDPPIKPTQLFDNMYAIGNTGTTAYVVKTSAGLLMIDSLPAANLDNQLLPGFMALGLNPADVKIIVLGHGHADHFGNARYFQDKYGTKVYLSAADWNLIENPPPGRNGQPTAPPQGAPKHDQVAMEGQPIVLGDFKITPVLIPGHTPGSTGYIFPVKDNGKTRVTGLYGGTILTPGPISDEGLATYVKSVEHFQTEAKKAGVEVVLQNHPLMLPMAAWTDKLQTAKKGDANPFVVGKANYQKFLDVLHACSEINVARRKST